MALSSSRICISHVRRRKKLLPYIFLTATLVWMVVIFLFSSQTADRSGILSGFIWRRLSDTIGLVFGSDFAGLVTEHIVRKAGHVAEYMILGILCALTVIYFGFKRPVLYPAAVCTVYAATDELHQIFVNGRGPALGDVLLDSVAALAAIIVLRLVMRRKIQMTDNR